MAYIIPIRSPHVGDKDFVDLFNGLVFDSLRYCIKGDPIPLVMQFNPDYFHVDEKIELTRPVPKHKVEFYILLIIKRVSNSMTLEEDGTHTKKKEQLLKH